MRKNIHKIVSAVLAVSILLPGSGVAAQAQVVKKRLGLGRSVRSEASEGSGFGTKPGT